MQRGFRGIESTEISEKKKKNPRALTANFATTQGEKRRARPSQSGAGEKEGSGNAEESSWIAGQEKGGKHAALKGGSPPKGKGMKSRSRARAGGPPRFPHDGERGEF